MDFSSVPLSLLLLTKQILIICPPWIFHYVPTSKFSSVNPKKIAFIWIRTSNHTYLCVEVITIACLPCVMCYLHLIESVSESAGALTLQSWHIQQTPKAAYCYVNTCRKGRNIMFEHKAESWKQCTYECCHIPQRRQVAGLISISNLNQITGTS